LTTLSGQNKQLKNRINEEQYLAEKRSKSKNVQLLKKLDELSSEVRRKTVMHQGLIQSKQLLIEEKTHLMETLEAQAQEFQNFKMRS
jgi:hypothetical protein